MSSEKRFTQFPWIVAIAGAVAVYAAVVVPEHHAIARTELQARTLYEAADSDERIVAQEPSIARERDAASIRIRSTITARAATSAMLEALDSDSRQFGVRIVGLRPHPAASPAPAKQPDPLNASGFSLELEGRYVSILRFLAGVSQSYPLLAIDAVTLQSGATQSDGVMLHASVDASAYELNPKWKEMVDRASSALR